MDEGQSVSSHVLKMKSFIDKLEHLGHPWSHVLAVNTVLGSVTKSFDNFVMNYNMHGWDNKSLGELHLMLKTAEKNVLSKSVVSSLHKIREAGGMRSSKRLENGAMVVHMGNGNEAEVEATETYFLNVPSGIELCL
ncbi:hypothetical protein Tco_1344943 [Tanacetum coccineum]